MTAKQVKKVSICKSFQAAKTGAASRVQNSLGREKSTANSNNGQSASRGQRKEVLKRYAPEPIQKTYGPFCGSATKTLTITPKESFTVVVHTALYEYVKLRVTQKVQCMSDFDLFDLEEFVGAEFWATLDEKERHLVGMCVGYLVLKEEVHLDGTGFQLTPPNNYHLACKKKETTR